MNKEDVARGATKGKSKRGSTNNQKRLDSFRKTVENRGNADWGDALPERIAGVVTAAQAVGGAVTFGLSRDGGAYMLTLLLDGERETLWFNADADIDEELFLVIETFKSLL